MLRWVCLFVCLAMLAMALPAFAGTAVNLRPRIEVTGPAVTMGDVFDGAGDASTRAIAPAPDAGQVSTLSVAFLQAAASSAGLDWTPPAGVTSVQVVHPAGARAFIGPSAQQIAANGGGNVAVHRGESVSLTLEAPGMHLAARVRAMSDGAIGQTIRFTNESSNRTIDALITGPGTATAQAQ